MYLEETTDLPQVTGTFMLKTDKKFAKKETWIREK